MNLSGVNQSSLSKSTYKEDGLKKAQKHKTTKAGKKATNKRRKDEVAMATFSLKKFIMELFGAFIIVYMGHWAEIFSDIGSSNQISTSLTVGFVVMVLTWIGSDISGAHYNPVTTVRNNSVNFLADHGILKNDPLEHCCTLLGLPVPRRTNCKCGYLPIGPRHHV